MPGRSHNWDPEDILRPRPTGLLGQAPSDILIERYDVADSRCFRRDWEQLKTAYLAAGMGLGAAVAGTALSLAGASFFAPDLDTLALSLLVWALICILAAYYFRYLFCRGVQA